MTKKMQPENETAIAAATAAEVELWGQPRGVMYYLTISQLRQMVHEANPKRHQVDAIAGSILRFGFTMPLVVDERTMTLAAGHGRLDGAALIFQNGRPPKYEGSWPPVGILPQEGEWLLPVLRHRFANDDERDAYVIADNRLSEAGGWDREALRSLASRLGPVRLDGIYTRDEYDRVVGKFKPVQVEEVDTSTLRSSFFLIVRGPVNAQPEVLRALKEHLGKLPGVTLEGRIDAAF